MASPQGGSEPLLADTRPSGLRQPLDLGRARKAGAELGTEGAEMVRRAMRFHRSLVIIAFEHSIDSGFGGAAQPVIAVPGLVRLHRGGEFRSEEHTSELQSLMRNSYAVFCLIKTHRVAGIIQRCDRQYPRVDNTY